MASEYEDIIITVQVRVTVPIEHSEFEGTKEHFDEIKKYILEGQEQTEHPIMSQADDISVVEI
jgi:hypothetical protein